jgi:hypothetical protein
LERLKETPELAGRDRRAGVGDGENSPSGLATSCDLDPPADDVVPDRVGNEVGGESLDEIRVARRPGRLERHDTLEVGRGVSS